MATPNVETAIQRHFTFLHRLGALDRRGAHLIDPWPIGTALGMDHDETERTLASLAQVGWIERARQPEGDRVALTVWGLARL